MQGKYCKSEIQDLVQDDLKLASLAGVYYELERATKDPNSAFEEIEQIILKDPSLTTRLLKIVNSAFYGFSSKVETISHAVSVIGTEQLSNLVLSTVVMDKFQGIPDDILNMNLFWQHSIACGLVCKKLAEYRGEPNLEKYFIAGLLHDIGRLVLCLKIPHRNWAILIRSDHDNSVLHLAETQELGFDHAQLGGALLKQWNLPEVYQEVVQYHHNPGKAPQFPDEVAHCHLADIIANTLKLGCSGESSIVPKLDEQAWARARPPKNISLSVIKDETEKIFEETARAFLSPN